MCTQWSTHAQEPSTGKTIRLIGVPVLLPSSYNRHSFINNFSSKCIQMARRSLENRRTFAHCASYSPRAPPHSRPMIQPSRPISGLQETDLCGLCHPGSLTVASRWILLTKDQQETGEWRTEACRVFTLTPPPCLPLPMLQLSLHVQLHGWSSHWVPGTLLPPHSFWPTDDHGSHCS